MNESTAVALKPVHPVTARDLLRCCSRGRMAMQDAEEAIRRSHIPAIANYTTYLKAGGGRQTDGRTTITDKIWSRIVTEKQRDRFWKRGAVTLPSTANQPGLELVGIWLEPAPLITHLERFGLAVEVDSDGQIVPPGDARVINAAGRNAYAHGAPIAALTLELHGQPEASLHTMKATALIPRLRDLYMEIGVPVPGARSLEGFAGGILAVLRKPRQPQDASIVTVKAD